MLGKMTSAEAPRKPSSLAFVKSVSVKVEAVEPTSYFFADFFAIWLRWATRFMGMQWQGA
jgi:hypothetical protein